MFTLVLVACLALDLEERKGDAEVETVMGADADAGGAEARVAATGWRRAEILVLVATIGQSVGKALVEE